MAVRDSHCIFCSIIASHDEKIILEENDSVVVIKDIRPASEHHFLVIPRQHIPDAKCLTTKDKPLVEVMMDKAEFMLRKNAVDKSDAKLVFHWPPFTSVRHLHLHVIAPVSSMSFLSKIVFKGNTWWCVTPEYVIQRISK